jgi:hypothetical protein
MHALGDLEPYCPDAPADQGPPPYDILAALVVSVRGELAEALAALAQPRGRAGPGTGTDR